MCPTVILATSLTVRLNGFESRDIVSIGIISGASGHGIPLGIKVRRYPHFFFFMPIKTIKKKGENRQCADRRQMRGKGKTVGKQPHKIAGGDKQGKRKYKRKILQPVFADVIEHKLVNKFINAFGNALCHSRNQRFFFAGRTQTQELPTRPTKSYKETNW